MISFRIDTKREELQPVTRQVADAVENAGVTEGICVVFCPHTTAAVTINENADPDVASDLLIALERAFPSHAAFRHMEGNSAAHAKAMATGSSVTIPIRGGRLALGRWQGVYFCEFDGPRSREFWVQIIPGQG